MEVVKQDIYHNKDRWEAWKGQEKKFEDVSPYNSKLLINFLDDMEKGVNTPKKKGNRTPTTLINQRDHIAFFLKHIKKPITQVTKDEIHNFVKKVEDGGIKKRDGRKFTAFGNYVKDLKSFFGWLVRTNKTKINITSDLSKTNDKKPAWVFLTEEQFRDMANQAIPNYRALIWFFYDAGCRVTEGYSLRVKNFHKDFTELEIPREVAKTFGRVITLKICSSLIKEYVKFHNLKPDDLLIVPKSPAFNKYLREHCVRIFGDKETPSRGKYSEFSIYSIRHNASCYWLKRYKQIKGLKYRMGWTREEQASYYHEFLGMSDEISDEDMLTGEDLNKVQKLEKQMAEIKKSNKKDIRLGKVRHDSESGVWVIEPRENDNYLGIKYPKEEQNQGLAFRKKKS
jgi:integrase